MSTTYTKEQWSNLTIQDRIKAMNKAVVKGDESIPIEDQASTPVLNERPKRTSVVDMWRQRENSSTLSAQPSVQILRSHAGQNQSEIPANSINSAMRKSISDSIAERTTIAMETVTSNSSSTEASTSSQVVVSTNKKHNDGLKSNETRAKIEVVDLDCSQATTSPSSPTIRKFQTQNLHLHNDLTIIDDVPEQCQQPVAMKSSVVDRWNKRGLTGSTDASPHVKSPTTDMAQLKEVHSKNNLDQKTQMYEQSITHRKSTLSWKSSDSTRDTMTRPLPSWQKPSNTSPFQLKSSNSVQQLNNGSTSLESPTHDGQQLPLDSENEAVQVSSISDGTPSLSHWNQDIQSPQQPQNESNSTVSTWPKLVGKVTPVTNPSSQWQKPTVVNEVKSSLQSPRDWQKSLRPTGVQVMGTSWRKPEVTNITTPSWRKNRENSFVVSAFQNPTELFGTDLVEQNKRKMQMAPNQRIISEDDETSDPTVLLLSCPNTEKCGGNSINTGTKIVSQKKSYKNVENQDDSRFLNEETTAKLHDTVLQTDEGAEGLNALYIWKQRESSLGQSSMSSPRRNLSMGKLSIMELPKKAHQLVPARKMASPCLDIEVNDEVIGKDLDGHFKEYCLRVTAVNDGEAHSENVCEAVEWPTIEEIEPVLQPLVHERLSSNPVYDANGTEEWKATSGLISDEGSKPSPIPIQSTINNYAPETWMQLGLLPTSLTSLDQSPKQSSSVNNSIPSEMWKYGHEQNPIERAPLEQEREVWHKPPAKSLLLALGRRYRSNTPSSLTGSVEEKKDGDGSGSITSSLIKKDQDLIDNSENIETRVESSGVSTGAFDCTSFLEPQISKPFVVNPTTTSLVESVVASPFLRKSTNYDTVETLKKGVDFSDNEPSRLQTKASDMGHPPDQIIESPSRKLSRTVEKKRVQQHRHKLKQSRNSDQSVSSVEGSVSDVVNSQCSLDIVPDRFELATDARKLVMVNSKGIGKETRSDYPYSPPVDYGLCPRYELNPNSSVDAFVERENDSPSHPLKVKSGQSAFSSPTNARGAFSLYSRVKAEKPCINTHSLYIAETTQIDFSPCASDTSPSSNNRSFNYRSTNRFKHKKQLEARAKLAPTNVNQGSNMSDTGQSDTSFSFFSTASSGCSAMPVEPEVFSTTPSSTLASRASLVLKGRRNRSSAQSPEEKSSVKDLTNRMLQVQPSKQPPCRDRTAAYVPSHRRDSGGGNYMAQRVGLSGRYNSSARFSETSTPQGPLAHSFRYSASNVHPQNTFSFGSHTSENSSNIYSLASSRSEESEAWATSGGAHSIRQKHSVSTEGTRSVQLDLVDQGFVDKIANFEHLQSAYRDMDLAQIALDLKEEVQTSFKGSVNEVTAIMTALLASPNGHDASQAVATADESQASRKRAPRPEADDDEEVAIEVQYIGEGEEEDLHPEADLSNLVSHSTSETEHRSGMSLRTKKEGGFSPSKPIKEQVGVARRGLV